MMDEAALEALLEIAASAKKNGSLDITGCNRLAVHGPAVPDA